MPLASAPNSKDGSRWTTRDLACPLLPAPIHPFLAGIWGVPLLLSISLPPRLLGSWDFMELVLLAAQLAGAPPDPSPGGSEASPPSGKKTGPFLF